MEIKDTSMISRRNFLVHVYPLSISPSTCVKVRASLTGRVNYFRLENRSIMNNIKRATFGLDTFMMSKSLQNGNFMFVKQKDKYLSIVNEVTRLEWNARRNDIRKKFFRIFSNALVSMMKKQLIVISLSALWLQQLETAKDCVFPVRVKNEDWPWYQSANRNYET